MITKILIPGDPIPYLRMTQGQVKLMRIPDYRIKTEAMLKVKRRIERYLNWKEFVRACALTAIYNAKPRNKVFLNVCIYFRNKKHADPENVRKGIQDALYEDDKYVAGQVDFFYDKENPRCEIEIVGVEVLHNRPSQPFLTEKTDYGEQNRATR